MQEDFLQTVKQLLLCLVGLGDKQLLKTDLIKKSKRVKKVTGKVGLNLFLKEW